MPAQELPNYNSTATSTSASQARWSGTNGTTPYLPGGTYQANGINGSNQCAL